MLNKVIQYKKDFLAILITLFIISYYEYLTWPVDLHSLIIKRPVESINISISNALPREKGDLPGELRLNNLQQINAVLNVLNKYKYSIFIKFYNVNTVPVNPSDGAIHIFIRYSADEGKFKEQYIFVDSENDIVIRNQQGKNIEYKITNSDQKIFDDLLSFLRNERSNK